MQTRLLIVALLLFPWFYSGAQTLTQVSVGNGPNSIAVNPVTGKVYVSDYAVSLNHDGFCLNPGTVTVVDRATNSTSTVTAGLCPAAIAANLVTNKIYVVNTQDFDLSHGSVTEIDGKTNATETIVVGDTPTSIAVNPVTNKIYVANEAGGSITVIDGATHATTTVTVGQAPQGVAVDPVTNTIVVACPGYVLNPGYGQIAMIDGATNHATLINTALETYSGPQLVAIDTARQKVYVPYSATTTPAEMGMLVMDEQGNIQQAVPLTGAVRSIDVNPVTNKIYVALEGALDVIDGDDPQQAPVVIPIKGTVSSVTVDSVSNTIYAAALYSGNITVVDGSTNAVTNLAVSGSPSHLTGATVNTASGKAYVVNITQVADHHITVAGSGPASTTIGAGSTSESIDLNPFTNTVYVANTNSSNVTVIHGADNSVTTVATDGGPSAVAVNAVTNKVYVADQYGSDVTVIDAANNNATVNVPVGLEPAALAVNPITNKVYVASFGSFTATGNMTVIYPAKNNATKTLSRNAFFSSVAANPVTNRVYAGYCNQLVPLTHCSVEVIDGATDAVIATIPTGDGLSLIAVNPVTNKVYVAVDSLLVIDGDTNQVVTQLSQDSDVQAILVDPATNTIYTANSQSSNLTAINGSTNLATNIATGTNSCPQGLALGPKNTIYVTDKCLNRVLLVDGADHSVGSVPAGSAPYVVAVNPVTGTPYVTNSDAGTVSVLMPDPVQEAPLNTSIQPLPNNQTSSATPNFTFTASSPASQAPTGVYFQVDTQSGAWMAAAAAGNGTFTGTLPSLLPGLHTLYAYAVNGAESTLSSQFLTVSYTNSPVIGNIAGYAFYETGSAGLGAFPHAALTVSPASIDFGVVRLEHEAARELLLSNVSGALVSNIRVDLVEGSRRNHDRFELEDTCRGSLGPGEHCRVRICLRAKKHGVVRAAVRVSYGREDATQDVPVLATVARR